MNLRDLMTTSTVTIDPASTIADARRLMTRHNIRHLPVMNGDRLVGMLSDRDVLRVRAAADDGEWWRVPVSIAMTVPVHTAGPDDSLMAIAARLATEKVGALPVVERGRLVGIVTAADVLAAEVRLAMAPRATRVAADAMTPSPITVRSRTPATEALLTMVGRRIHHLPVVDDANNLIGMVSDRDVRQLTFDLTTVAATHPDARVHVDDVMDREPPTVRFDAPLIAVAGRIAAEHLDAVIVTDNSGAMVGLASYVDVLRALAA